MSTCSHILNSFFMHDTAAFIFLERGFKRVYLGFLYIKKTKQNCDFFQKRFSKNLRISEIFTKSIFSSTCVIQPIDFTSHCCNVISAVYILSHTHTLYPVALYLSWDERVFVSLDLSSLQEAIMCVRPTQTTFLRNSPEALMHTGQSSPEPTRMLRFC